MADTPKTSVLDKAPRAGFTAHCAEFFNAVIPVDEITEAEVAIFVQRRDRMDLLIGLQKAKTNGAIKRATLVSRN